MYHQQQQRLQSHNQHLSSRPSLPPEKQFLLQGGGDSGLILSTDAKPRLKWTPELHERFVEAVNQLGGPEKATPKTIMRLMGIPGLTLYHLKSHLQKYRLSKNLQAQANAVHAKNVSGCRKAADKLCEGNGSPASHFNLEPEINRSMHISEALQMQIEVQRRLHEQLEVQRHLQLRIEAQGKYLQSVLEKAQEALAKQSVDGLQDAAAAAAAAASKMTEHAHRRQHGDGSSVDSCLTACEGSSSQLQLLSIGLCTTQQQSGELERDSSGRRPTTSTKTTSSCEEYMLFLDEEPSRGGGASDDHCCEITTTRDDGFPNALGLVRTRELDLTINNTSSSTASPASCRRPRYGDRIDLNGSSWN